MPAAKSNFLERIAILKRTLSSDFLRDNGVAVSTHNEKARILRNGISIIAFTILEDFIKDRTGEVLQSIGTSSINFNSLNQEIQQAATINALRSIQERANNLKRGNEDWLTFIQNETSQIASTSGFPYSISKFSLGWDKSNLSKDDIPKFMKILNVEGGWNSIRHVTTNANVTLVGPDNFFLNAANRRHKAAHNPNANSLYSDLIDFYRDVKSFAFAYDALISKGLAHIIANNPINVTHNHITLRFLIKDSGVWKEYNSTSGRPIRTDRNYNRILAQAKRRAINRNATLVIKNSIGEIHNWLMD
jgi:hypothetical protein